MTRTRPRPAETRSGTPLAGPSLGGARFVGCEARPFPMRGVCESL